MNKSVEDESIICDGSHSQILVLGQVPGLGGDHGTGRLWEDAWRDFFKTYKVFGDGEIAKPLEKVSWYRVFYVPKGYQAIRKEGGPWGFEIIFKDEGGNEIDNNWKHLVIAQEDSFGL